MVDGSERGEDFDNY